jgi:hypothetical protein
MSILASPIFQWAYPKLFPPFLLIVALLAWWRAQWPERAAATLFVAAWIGTQLFESEVHQRWFYLETGVLAVDVTLTIGLGYLAVRSGRGWLIFATAIQLLSTMAHLGRVIEPHFSALAYAIMEGASAWPTVIALAIGVWRNPRRSKAQASG